MTFVEFYDHTSIENVCSSLIETPDEVIFLGFDASKLETLVKVCEKLFSSRGQSVVWTQVHVPQHDLATAVVAIERLIHRPDGSLRDDLVFDITGGDPLLTMALGVVLRQYKPQHFRVHCVSVDKNQVFACGHDGKTVSKAAPKLTVAENIVLYKGDLLRADANHPEWTYTWQLDVNDFLLDIKAAWEICRERNKKWNKHIDVFGVLVDHFSAQPSQRRYDVPLSDLMNELSHEGKRIDDLDADITAKLKNSRLITHFCDGGADSTAPGFFQITFKNEQVKRLLSKAGQALELYVYTQVLDTNIFNNAETGVVIDWDGSGLENLQSAALPQAAPRKPENEIDVMAMHNLIPLFISCKNGLVNREELYKFETVVQRFGGKYAKKLLIVTGSPSNKIRTLAEKMGIVVIERLKHMTDEQFKQHIIDYMNT